MDIELVAIVVDDYDRAIRFVVEKVAVFLDVAGNRWDLLGPA